MSESTPRNDESLPVDVELRIDAVCARFETACKSAVDKAGEWPIVEAFLTGTAGRVRSALLRELIVLEASYLREAGQVHRLEDYRQRFPELPSNWLDRAAEAVPRPALSSVRQADARRLPALGDLIAALASPAPGNASDSSHSNSTTPDAMHDQGGTPSEGAHVSNASGWAGRFRIEEEIGKGGMGDVFRVRDDKLNRTLAVKVLKERFRGDVEMIARFLEEAQVTGQLQHPGIPPIHELGELADGRPFFAMKLIQGQTLAVQLEQRSTPADDLPRWLAVFEHICQAVAYAHSREVIHRDLKPLNVMVGAFGEVQVMDWGLAKVLSSSASGAEAGCVIRTVRTQTPDQSTQTGVVGTFAYMPPEQARGEIDRLDERSDVFGLGAILCEVLTGAPPYRGTSAVVRHKTERADLADALARLEASGADAELVGLAKACLASRLEERPRDGKAVAEAVAGYQAGVQRRLREAEVERAETQVKAIEERKRRRVLLALLLLLLVGGAGGAWLWQQRRHAADTTAQQAIDDGRRLRERAKAEPLGDADLFREAEEAARKAVKWALSGRVSAGLRRQAEELVEELRGEADATVRDHRLLAALLEIGGPGAERRYQKDDKALVLGVTEQSVAQQLRQALLVWGLDLEATPTAEAASRLRGRPAAVVIEVTAALYAWASALQQQDRSARQRLSDLAHALEGNAGSKRRELWAILERRNLRREQALATLALAMRPVPIPFDAGLGTDRTRLRRLAEATNAETEPVLGLLFLARALMASGDDGIAESLLRTALRARPREVILHNNLGALLAGQQRWREAVECFSAARVLRPELGARLAETLEQSGRVDEGLALFRHLQGKYPDNPGVAIGHGAALGRQGRVNDAIASFQKAIAINANNSLAHFNLGSALYRKRLLNEAIACYQKAIDLDPKLVHAYNGMGAALDDEGRFDEAIASYRKAIDIRPNDVLVLYNLGMALQVKGSLDEAIVCFRKVIDICPDDAPALCNLGMALQAKGSLDEAIACFRKAIEGDPNHASAHNNLGAAFNHQGLFDEAIVCLHKAIEINPASAESHTNLGNALNRKGRLDDAFACHQKAIDLNPNLASAHSNLGAVLYAMGRLDDAIARLQKALDIDPKLADARVNLGCALSDNGRPNEAIACFRKAIGIAPNSVQAHGALGQTLLEQGRFAQAEASTRRSLQLLPLDHPLRPIVLAQRQKCRYWRDLEKELPDVLAGKIQPDSAQKRVEYAQLCMFTRHYPAGARLYADAFTIDPKLAGKFQKALRYNAACCAVLAGCAQGKELDKLDEEERARLRQQALAWLRADLMSWNKVLDKGNAKTIVGVQQNMRRWQSNVNLSGVRDKDALVKLPGAEQQTWRKLWADVDALLKRSR